jgi:hypothetical protein
MSNKRILSIKLFFAALAGEFVSVGIYMVKNSDGFSPSNFMELFLYGSIPVIVAIVIPNILVRADLKNQNTIGFGYPFLLALPLIYFIYDAQVCTGKFCDLGDILFAWAFGICAVVSLVVFGIGLRLKNLNEKSLIFVVFLEAVLTTAGAAFLLLGN